MTSPDRASTRISLKPRSAAKQALAALMWRRTAARLRNSPRLESLPVFVQLTQTKRVTPHWIGGPASGPAPAARAMSGRVKQQVKQVKGGVMGSAAKLAAQRQAAALNKSKRAKKNAKVISSEEDELDKGSASGSLASRLRSRHCF